MNTFHNIYHTYVGKEITHIAQENIEGSTFFIYGVRDNMYVNTQNLVAYFLVKPHVFEHEYIKEDTRDNNNPYD